MWLFAIQVVVAVFFLSVWKLYIKRVTFRVGSLVRSLEPDWPPSPLQRWLPLELQRVRTPSLDQLLSWSEQHKAAAFDYYQTDGGFRVHVSNPLDVAAVLNISTASKPASAYRKLRSFLGPRGLLTQLETDDVYTFQRRTICRAFHSHAVRTTMAEVVKEHALKLRAMWWKRIAQPNGIACSVTMMPYYDIAECMISILCGIAAFRVCPTISLRDVAADFRRATAMQETPSPLSALLRSVGLPRSGRGDASTKSCLLVEALAKHIVRVRLSSEQPSNDEIPDKRCNDASSIMSRIIECVSACSPLEMHAIDHVRTLLFAGFETTTNAVLWAIALLAEHRGVQNQLAQELREAIPDPSHCPDISHIQALPLLQNVVKEVLRLYPPVPIVCRTVTSESSTVSSNGRGKGKDGLFLPHSGVCVPVGTTVAVNLFAMQRNPSVFGSNPHAFDPSRWLRKRATECVVERPSFLPFSAGPRSCVGRDIAQIELLVMVAVLVRSFEFQPLISSTTSIDNTASLKAFHVTLSPEAQNNPLRVKVILRE